MYKQSTELLKRINTILESIWHWWEFFLVEATDNWYIVYAEEVCFRI